MNPRAMSLAKQWEEAAHSLKGLPHLTDIRNYGLILGLELEPLAGQHQRIGRRAADDDDRGPAGVRREAQNA